MLERMSTFLFPVVITVVIATASERCTLGVEPAKGLWITSSKTGPMILDGDHREILVYRQRGGGSEYKPYVEQIFSPAGVQVLRDSPHDHQHHHALMFATAVDGVDFWSQGAGFGKEKDVSLTIPNTNIRSDAARAAFVEELHWLDPRSNKPLLVERRTIAAMKTPGNKATLVEWRSRLQTPPGKDAAVLSGGHYFGLGMRFVESMDSGGRFFNADDKLGEIVRGDERLTPVKWCALTAKANGKPVTVAMFDHPKNLRHPAKMFTMSTPFAYLSATCNVWKEPITIKAGKPLDLRYGVAVWDGAVDKKTVEKLYQRWLKISPNELSK
jgi:hypothetical protein